MLRVRLFSFTLGFAMGGAAISHFIWKDFWATHNSLCFQVKDNFDSLQSRVSILESTVPRSSHHVQLEDDG